MGNRAVIAFVGATKGSACIYLHWNGGRASVEAFLAAARDLNICHLDRSWGLIDQARAMDQLGTLVARNFFGHDIGFTVYVEDFGVTDKDNGDNGVYLIDDKFFICGRLHAPRREEVNGEKTKAIFDRIVERAPIFND